MLDAIASSEIVVYHGLSADSVKGEMHAHLPGRLADLVLQYD